MGLGTIGVRTAEDAVDELADLFTAKFGLHGGEAHNAQNNCIVRALTRIRDLHRSASDEQVQVIRTALAVRLKDDHCELAYRFIRGGADDQVRQALDAEY